MYYYAYYYWLGSLPPGSGPWTAYPLAMSRPT